MADLVCDGSGNIAVSEIIDAINENSDKLGVWDSNIEYEVGAFIYSAADGFYYQALVTNTGSQPIIGNDNWQRWSPVNYLEFDTIRTVGATGDYANLELALRAASRWQTVDGSILTLEIEDGHVIDYPISIGNLPNGISVTYAGVGSLSVVVNGDISSNPQRIYSYSNEPLLFEGITFAITGSITSNNVPYIFYGSISFNNCNFAVNLSSVTVGEIFRLRRGEMRSDTVTQINIDVLSPSDWDILHCEYFYLPDNTTINANNLSLGKLFMFSYGSSGFHYGLNVENAHNVDHGLYIYGMASPRIADSNFRKGSVDDSTDIDISHAMANFTNVIGGTNIVLNTFTSRGFILE